jgi:hypothetical protein
MSRCARGIVAVTCLTVGNARDANAPKSVDVAASVFAWLVAAKTVDAGPAFGTHPIVGYAWGGIGQWCALAFAARNVANLVQLRIALRHAAYAVDAVR